MVTTIRTVSTEVARNRRASYDILPLLLNRWSPRSMTGESLTDEELFPLFEAARWAPSSFNSQLWRFIVARRQNPEEFAKFQGLLVPGNAAWAKDAAALIVVASRQNFEHSNKPAVTHAFDAGAAWENIALEAARRGLVTHGMQGFDYDRARQELGIPDDFDVLAMIAIGKRGPLEKLPEKLQAVEHPNSRRPLREILFEGAFGRTIDRLK
jgi:nitroreductase